MGWVGGDQDTFRLLLAAWINLGGESPSGAMKREGQKGGTGTRGKMEGVSRRVRKGKTARKSATVNGFRKGMSILQ